MFARILAGYFWRRDKVCRHFKDIQYGLYANFYFLNFIFLSVQCDQSLVSFNHN